MPQQLLSPYEPTTLTQNISYTLPAVLCSVTATAACETSTNGSTWIPFSNGTETSAAFIRSAGVGTVVTCKPVMSGVGGESGGGGLPTAVVGQVLISQGAGVQPIFSDIATINTRLWVGGAFYELNRIGLGGTESISRDVNNGAIVLSQANSMMAIPARPLSQILAPTIIGTVAAISDSTVATWGATVVGGGSNQVLARWNGTIWKVFAA